MIRVVTRVAALVVVLLLSACSSNAGTPHGVALRPSPSPARQSVAGPTVPPTPSFAREANHPDPNFDMGYTVQITAQGFHPAVLIAPCCGPITWRNLTGSTTSVVFDVEGIDSGPIPPGGAYVFTPPNAESLAYHAGTDASMTAAVQVNQTIE